MHFKVQPASHNVERAQQKSAAELGLPEHMQEARSRGVLALACRHRSRRLDSPSQLSLHSPHPSPLDTQVALAHAARETPPVAQGRKDTQMGQDWQGGA